MSDTPRQVDQSCVHLWLPNGTYDFTISDGETTLTYHAVVDGEDIEVEPEPLTVPVTPACRSSSTRRRRRRTRWAGPS